ncbi:HlyC/CorC family transporter [Flavisolibacter sp. BT320]|nr:HlyC/CorC family transporter [Flavisolibacter longurius]
MVEINIIVWFFVTLLLMGFFAGVQMAFYSVNRFSIELRKKQGNPDAILLSKYFENPELFLSTMLIGFTIFLVWFALLFNTITEYLWNLANLHNVGVRVFLDIVLATLIVMVLGEFVPRAMFRAHSNIILSRLVWLINFIHIILQPIARLFLAMAGWTLQYIFNIKVKESKEVLPPGTLETLFQQNEGPDNDSDEMDTELFENALELPRVKIRQCLVPRKEVVGVDVACTVEEARQKFIETKLSKLVVYDKTIDNIVGYIHQLDLFKHPASLQAILLPIPAVPESMSATDLIGKFTKERKSIAWVVDEFGGTAGIVTMEDVLEEIFGEIHDEYDSEEFVEKRLSENEYIFSGRLELDYISEKYDLDFPENESETLSGFIISHHETIPQQKERIIIDDFEFDILSVTNTRIEMVKMKVLK